VTPISNKFNLPLPLLLAVQADPYDSEGSDVTVTGLLKPVQMWVLEKRHKDKIEIDVTERLWALYGQLMALLLERVVKSSPELANRYAVEQRCSIQVHGWKVSGAFDLYDRETMTLSDWKFVGAFAAKMAKAGKKDEWEQQLNILRWLYEGSHGPCADRLEIVCLLRDFSEKVEREDGLLPAETIEMPCNGLEATEMWVEDRVLTFQQALLLPDDKLPPCTNEERWYRNGVYKRCERYCPVRSICRQNLAPSNPKPVYDNPEKTG
jgi:hypothetical protein